MNPTTGAVLVTGSNGAIGSVIVEHLLSRGVTAIACHYRTSRDRVTALLERHGLPPTRHCLFAELTSEEDIEAMRLAVEDRFGPVGTLVNVAGGSDSGLSWKLSKQQFLDVINTNLTTTFLSCRAFIPGMRDRSFGRIINVSSVVASVGAAGASHYGAAKAGINGMSKSMALELADRGITVNVLALGYFDSGIINTIPAAIQQAIVARIPVRRLGKSTEEIGGLVHYLMSPEAAYVTGQVFHINGGLY